jgi:hypothetical protein
METGRFQQHQTKEVVDMKRKLFILAFLLCALTLISDYAMADFYVIAGGRRVGTEIKSLP